MRSADRAAARRYERMKRWTDVAISVSVLIVTAPLQVAVAVLVRCSLDRPVLFSQQRPGLHGAPFTLIKFRTMRHLDPRRGWVCEADRITPVGARLRRLSLDELPTLWNVLRGDMSLVGPRPLLMQYLPRYTPTQAHRHDVRPGITGLAQVSGRNALTWEQKFAADLQYVKNRSMGLDFAILLRTIWSVLARNGISASGHTTMPEFHGSSDSGQQDQ